MKRAAFVIAFLLTAVSCASTQQQSRSHVDRAVQALGGAEALGKIRTVATKGTGRLWEPEQSMAAGGEMRFAGESTFDALTDIAARTTRIDSNPPAHSMSGLRLTATQRELLRVSPLVLLDMHRKSRSSVGGR